MPNQQQPRENQTNQQGGRDRQQTDSSQPKKQQHQDRMRPDRDMTDESQVETPVSPSTSSSRL